MHSKEREKREMETRRREREPRGERIMGRREACLFFFSLSLSLSLSRVVVLSLSLFCSFFLLVIEKNNV